jgi:predicted tellurium resistance membrane protein TerC
MTTPMEWLASPDAWIALAALTALELVLGIDNIVFISIKVVHAITFWPMEIIHTYFCP